MAATGATLIPKALSLENLRERRASYEKEPLASQSGWGGASDVDTVSTVCVETPSPPSTSDSVEGVAIEPHPALTGATRPRL